MVDKNPNFKYGKPVNPEKITRRKKRLPIYNEVLREFLSSGNKMWVVNMDELPTKNSRVVRSSLKWRVKHYPEFNGIKVFMSKNEVYIERVDENEQPNDRNSN